MQLPALIAVAAFGLQIAGLAVALDREAHLAREVAARASGEPASNGADGSGRGPELWRHRAAGSAGFAGSGGSGGACTGAELDLRWDPDRGLRVSHGAPGPGAPTLGSLLMGGALPRGLWLDWKGLDPAVAAAATPELTALVATHGKSHRFWVEATDLAALASLGRAIPGLRLAAHATLWRRLRPGPGSLSFLADLVRYRIDAVAMPASALTPGLARGFAPLALLVWTVDEPADLEALGALRVRVALTDGLCTDPGPGVD